ncbi:hypothetical protein AGMMS49921_05660 [Endomicrobiia bacterium]|nr:hypothetical protein AGMMS49921_05660 [Endomicrobiia bacterium]
MLINIKLQKYVKNKENKNYRVQPSEILIVKLLPRKQAVRKPLKVVQLGYGNA